jgi:serine/threonine protein kinase
VHQEQTDAMKKLDRFILRDILSDGPAGTVYRADEILPGDNRRTVALKVLPPLEGALNGETAGEARFFGEVRALAQLSVHPHVVTIYAMGLTDGYPWLAMEFAPTTFLQKLGDAPADPAEVFKLLEQVSGGLAAMHGLKPPLIHQDLKPANVLVDAVGNYKITDFSLSTVTAANRTHGLATVRYAAPELLTSELGQVGPATDLYALGHMAYEMALGARAHRQQFPAVFEGNAGKEPPPNKWMMWHASGSTNPAPAGQVVRGFPGSLSEVIARLMTKPLGERYASASELLSDLSMLRMEVLAGPAAASSPPLPPPTPAATSTAHLPSAAASAAGRGVQGMGPLDFAPTAGTASSTPPPPHASAAAGAPSGGMAAGNTRYWVRLRNRITGPFDLPSMQRQVKQGAISRLHQVSTDQVVWKQATEIEGLYGPAVV